MLFLIHKAHIEVTVSPEEESRRISSLKLILMEIALLFSGHLEQRGNKKLPLWLTELCRKMSLKENFTQGIDRLFVLSRVSREHLSRSFKKHLGITPTEYVKRLRLNYAANQLANTTGKLSI
jgi:AraC family cel operon transcriptional repressor